MHNIGFGSAVQKSKISFLLFAMLSPFAIFALRRTRQFTAQDAKNAQSVVVKDEFINVMTGDENLYYIGDLNSGDYNIMLETDDLILVGNFII